MGGVIGEGFDAVIVVGGGGWWCVVMGLRLRMCGGGVGVIGDG